MKNIKLMLHDDKFATIDASAIVYASEEEEFFYESDNEPVSYGEPIGIEVPSYQFEHLQYSDQVNAEKEADIKERGYYRRNRSVEKWNYNASQELEAMVNGWIQPSSIDLVLFKNIYWKPLNEK